MALPPRLAPACLNATLCPPVLDTHALLHRDAAGTGRHIAGGGWPRSHSGLSPSTSADAAVEPVAARLEEARPKGSEPSVPPAGGAARQCAAHEQHHRHIIGEVRSCAMGSWMGVLHQSHRRLLAKPHRLQRPCGWLRLVERLSAHRGCSWSCVASWWAHRTSKARGVALACVQPRPRRGCGVRAAYGAGAPLGRVAATGRQHEACRAVR